ncbi:hypothetical protein ABTN08_19350, partial [Acinetobacter baumannii]
MTRPMTLDKIEYPAGTFVLLTERNGDNLLEDLRKAESSRGVKFVSLTTAYPDKDRTMPGSAFTLSLQSP